MIAKGRFPVTALQTEPGSQKKSRAALERVVLQCPVLGAFWGLLDLNGPRAATVKNSTSLPRPFPDSLCGSWGFWMHKGKSNHTQEEIGTDNSEKKSATSGP